MPSCGCTPLLRYHMGHGLVDYSLQTVSLITYSCVHSVYYSSWLCKPLSTYTRTHSILMAIFPGEPGLASCPFNSSPFIPKLHMLLSKDVTFDFFA